MAEHLLIDRYIGELGREVGRMRHAEEILAEVADHLLEAVAMHSRRGLDPVAAQRRALLEFGDPGLVGTAFASAGSGGIAVPTQFTRRAGIGLVASSAAWLVGLAGFYWSDVLDATRAWEGAPRTVYMLSFSVWTVAATLFVIGIAGLNRRHGGAPGAAGRAAFWIAISTVLFVQAPWAWGFWSTSLALAGASLSYGLVRADLVPRQAALMIGLGSVTTAAALWAYQLTGNEISFGEGPATAVAAIGLAAFCAGLAVVGTWLRAETPADDPPHMATA